MLTHLLSLVAAALVALPGFEPGQTLVYRGGVAERGAEDGSQEAPPKAFDLTWFVASADHSGAKLYWLVEERGRGAWPWPERFGQVSLDAQGRPQGATGPALLYDFGEGESAVALPLPLVVSEVPLALKAKWTQASDEYEVLAEAPDKQRPAWQVQVRNNYGVKRTMNVGKAAPLLTSLNERVFMNKGTEYALSLKLADIEQPAPAEATATNAAFDSLLTLRAKLHHPARSTDSQWNAEQIAVLSAALPDLEKQTAGGPLARLVAAAARDLKLQGGRAGDIAELVAKYQGQPLPKLNLDSLSGDPVTNESLAGQVTVLHFWEYRDQPLKEPYGQVGYLEFLHQKRKDQGLKVYGVAVDSRLREEAERRVAIVGIRKLKSFMNLSYPLLLDGGEGIKAVGDPRVVGATLPLVVVVGRDGRVAHYHVGFYDVDRQEGLKELDMAVGQALKK